MSFPTSFLSLLLSIQVLEGPLSQKALFQSKSCSLRPASPMSSSSLSLSIQVLELFFLDELDPIGKSPFTPNTPSFEVLAADSSLKVSNAPNSFRF